MRNRLYWAIQNVSRETYFTGGSMMAITLTYRRVGQWSPNQIGGFITWLRERYGGGYAWCAELQKRGAMHYHVLTVLPPGDTWSKKEMDFEWYHGFTWITHPVEKPGYIMKYFSKGKSKDGKQYPKGARICGYSRPSVYLDNRANADRMASRFPAWVQECLDASGREEYAGTCYRDGGCYSIGGQMAVNPYSTTRLPDIWQIEHGMRLAWTGEMWYSSNVVEASTTK